MICLLAKTSARLEMVVVCRLPICPPDSRELRTILEMNLILESSFGVGSRGDLGKKFHFEKKLGDEVVASLARRRDEPQGRLERILSLEYSLD